MPVLAVFPVGRYKETLYFSIVPTLYYCRTLTLFLYGNQNYQAGTKEKYKLFLYSYLVLFGIIRHVTCQAYRIYAQVLCYVRIPLGTTHLGYSKSGTGTTGTVGGLYKYKTIISLNGAALLTSINTVY